MFENLINQFRPTLDRAAHTAETLSHRAIAHLEIIAENTRPDPSAEVRRYERTTLAANATGVELFQVPSGQTWFIEAATMVPLAAGNVSVTLRNGPGGAPVFAANPSTPGTVGGSGVVLSAGMVVVADNGAIATEIVLQIRRRVWQPERKKRTTNAGPMEVQPIPEPDQITPGHVVSGVQQGNNVRGERHELARLR